MEGKHRVEFLVPVFLVLFIAVPFFVVMAWSRVSQVTPVDNLEIEKVVEVIDDEIVEEEALEEVEIQHVALPEEVRGIYWTASTAKNSRGEQLLEYMVNTGLNAVVIDVKYDNGSLAFDVSSEPIEDTIFPRGKNMASLEELGELLGMLYESGIYRIARVAVMRDGAFGYENPELVLRTASGAFWLDSIGSVWVDPAATAVADYALDLGRELYEAGFDEIQYDYVRFASDGAINAIVYPYYAGMESKEAVMQRFFKTVGGTMREEGIPVSFDLFGMTYWSYSDFNIGQRLVDALPYADWISPMVYPSHYPDGFEGFANPADNPYEIVKRSLDEGVKLVLGVYAGSEEDLRARTRPWLQDFDIGAMYTSALIEAQIQAARDAGASGWILWNARNVYEPANYR